MISEALGGMSRKRSKGPDQELDALVARELEALFPRVARRRKVSTSAEGDQAAAARPEEAEGAPIRQPTQKVAKDSNVIGMPRMGTAAGKDSMPFSDEEEAFIEQSVRFLRGRENADIIVEDIWGNIVAASDDEILDGPENEGNLAHEAARADGDATLLGDDIPGEPAQSGGNSSHHPESAAARETKPSQAAGRPKTDTAENHSVQGPAVARPRKSDATNDRDTDRIVE